MEKFSKYFAYVIFVLTYAIYYFTSAPGLMFTDSGELALACTNLGVAHPTGYPLFTLLGHLWTLIVPFIAPIRALNLLAGIYTALSAVFFYFWLTILLDAVEPKQKNEKLSLAEYRLISLFMALFYAFGSTVWSQATSIEVYSLHLLLLNLVLYFAFKAKFSPVLSNKYYFLASLVLGLSFANHATTVLLLPVILYMFFSDKNGKLVFSASKFKYFLFLLIPLIIGASVYLYLPIRSSMTPDFNWGEVHRSWDKFIYHVSGKQYQVWMFNGFSSWKTNLLKFIELLPTEFAYVGLIFSVIGIIAIYKKAKFHFYFPLFIIFFCILYTFNYGIHDIDSYFLTAFIGIYVSISYCIVLFFARKAKFRKYIFILALLPITSFFLNFSQNDESNNYTVPEFKRLVVESAGENAFILTSQWDYWYSAFLYEQLAEKKYSKIIAIDKELLRRTWYRNQVKHQYPDLYKKIATEYDLFYSQLELFESGSEYSAELIQSYFINLLNKMLEVTETKMKVYATLDVLQTESAFAMNYQKVPRGLLIELTKDSSYNKLNPKLIDLNKIKKSITNKEGHLYKGVAENISVMMYINAQYAANNKDFSTAKIFVNKSLTLWSENSNAINLYNALANF